MLSMNSSAWLIYIVLDVFLFDVVTFEIYLVAFCLFYLSPLCNAYTLECQK